MTRLALLLLVALAPVAAGDELGKAKRVVFLGDSNTFAGKFITYLDCDLIRRDPTRKVELVNLGLPSETVSGLSEADHPYPRPCIHARLAEALRKTKPDVVVACYGMNDGIYAPFDETRFKAYQDGMAKLVADCERAGARVILMTPCPFDPLPLKDKVLPAGAEKYSWMRPYEKYDDVLGKYSEWLLTWRKKGYLVADPHSAIRAHLAEMRKKDAKYHVSSDGIHPNAVGHSIIHHELAKGIGLKRPVASSANGREGGRVNEYSYPIAQPVDTAWKGVVLYPPTVYVMPPDNLRADDEIVVVNGKEIGRVSVADFKNEVHLPWAPSADESMRAANLLKSCEEKTKVLGLAWLTDVGHQRPVTPKGIALADAEKAAAKLDAVARDSAKPIALSVTLMPNKK